MWRNRATLFILLALTTMGSAAGQTPGEVKSVTYQLVCTCGCGNMIVANCSCSEADRVRKDVSGLLASGLSRDEILEQYARRYGTEVLAAPPARGFGLSAWVMPFVALAGAAWFLSRRLHRWARAPLPVALPQTEKFADRYAERLEQEIQDA